MIYIRPNILQLTPYSTARDDYQGGDISVWLDANESPFENGVNRYPDPHQRALKAVLSEVKGVPASQIFVGNGSDEAIDLCFRIFCEPGQDNVVAIAPSYGMYAVSAAINHVAVREVPLQQPDFALPVDELLAAADAHTRLMWICSPNNPTGNAFSREQLCQLLRQFDGVVVVDEAYVDFSAKGSMLEFLSDYPNLIVLQTLSKAWGMAGLRLGLAFASEEIASVMARVKYPYNVNGPTQAEVIRRLQTEPHSLHVATLVEERERLARLLPTLSCVKKVYPSDANFFLVQVDDADRLYDYLVTAGIIVRNRHRVKGCEGCLRLTIGTPEENRRLLQALRAYAGEAVEESPVAPPASAPTGPITRTFCDERPAGWTLPPCQEKDVPRPLLFIDRDGTIIREPEDEQIDSLEKLEFVPGVLSALVGLNRSPYVPVMVSNQDGLGTDSFPESTFWPAHQKMLDVLAGEGFRFAAEHIDRTFAHEGAPTRKPGTAMLGVYRDPRLYDLAHSFVIGDRATDVQLAVNLGCRAILLRTPDEAARLLTAEQQQALALATDSWAEVAEFLRTTHRQASLQRATAETAIEVAVDLDGKGETRVDTGLKFFDHMLTQLPHHSGISLVCTCRGDLQVDEHHTMEDVAIALGETLRRALGDKRGMERYGFVLPMDECDAFVSFDWGGRIDFQWNVPFTREYVGDTPTEMYKHFFQSLAAAMQCNLHVSAQGENNHHLIEGVFKAFARALRQAIRREVGNQSLPSSKGTL